MSDSTDHQSTKKKRGCWVPLIIGCGGLMILTLLAGGVFLYAGWLGYQEAPKLVEAYQPGSQLENPYVLSPGQEEVILTYGYPESFTILFYEEEAVEPSLQDVRLESWDYYTQGMGFTFINGELTAEDPLDLKDPGVVETLPYLPEQFGAYMSLDEVLSAARLESYIEIPMEEAFLEDAEVYYGEALTFGLVDGELRFIEALALTAAE